MKIMCRLSWLLFLPLFIWGQEYEQSPLSIFESFRVDIGTVEAVVTDAEGNHVTGLPKGSFTLLVDGKATDIATFEEVKEGIELAVGEPGGFQAPAAQNYLIFMDDWFSRRAYRYKLLEKLRSEITRIGEKDRVAIVRFTGTKIQTLLDYTSDKRRILAKIERLLELPTTEMRRIAEGNALVKVEGRADAVVDRLVSEASLEEQSPASMSASRSNPAQFANENFATATRNQNRDETYFSQVLKSVNAIEVAMRRMDQKKGRQNLLIVSEGWITHLPRMFKLAMRTKWKNKDVFGDETMRILAGAKLKTAEDVLRPISDTANVLGYTIYPMNLAQVQFGEFMLDQNSAEERMSQSGGEFYSMQDSLRFLADQTGGKLVQKSQGAALPFTQVQDDLKNYYVMSFVLPPDRGERREIVLQMKGDYKIRHRKEFRQRPEAEQDKLASLSGLMSDDKGRLIVKLGTAQASGRRKQQLPFTLEIPTDWLEVFQVEDNFSVQLELTVESMDVNDNSSEMLKVPVNFSGKGTPAGFAFYDGELLLRKKKQRLVFVLLDKIGGDRISQYVDYIP